jgi:hypothetical protein
MLWAVVRFNTTVVLIRQQEGDDLIWDNAGGGLMRKSHIINDANKAALTR